MRKYIQRVLLWLFVINLGIVFGAGIYGAKGRHPPLGEQPAADVAQHRPRVLGLRYDGAPHAAHTRQLGRCLAGAGAKALLVARCGRDQYRGADRDLLVLHPNDALAAGHQGFTPSGGSGGPVAMAASGLRPSCSHSGGVACSTQGVLLAGKDDG